MVLQGLIKEESSDKERIARANLLFDEALNSFE